MSAKNLRLLNPYKGKGMSMRRSEPNVANSARVDAGTKIKELIAMVLETCRE